MWCICSVAVSFQSFYSKTNVFPDNCKTTSKRPNCCTAAKLNCVLQLMKLTMSCKLKNIYIPSTFEIGPNLISCPSSHQLMKAFVTGQHQIIFAAAS